MERLALTRDQHAESLERLCATALSSGDFETAFMYADRRCRIQPFAKSHHFSLRAEALIRLGDHAGAISDIRTALALSPEDIQANRRMMLWGNAEQKRIAARALVAADDEAATLIQALEILRHDGSKAIGAARVFDETITGWAAWNGPDAPILTIRNLDSERAVALMAERDHPLNESAFEHVAGFHVLRSESSAGEVVSLVISGETFFKAKCPTNVERIGKPSIGVPVQRSESAGITVIVPVYRDLAATRDCLESLAPEIVGRAGRRAIVVDDATPEPKLASYLRSFCRKTGFLLLGNSDNLGFVGSVNRALSHVEDDDVVLLNADTILPPGCIGRLAAIARSDPAIGTVTPLSNNGEFTSFPVAFEQNPLPAHEGIIEIDRIAAVVNHGRLVDLPNGIGFCLYISRGCLDAVGELSQSYQRGYLEDVDFCLRAREQGFRNVCASSVYVGHHGSRSFGDDKRALVVRNIAVTEIKFPDYRQECALFMAADPLRVARRAIERHMIPVTGYDFLLVCGNGLLQAVAQARAAALQAKGKTTLLLAIKRTARCSTLQVIDTGGDAPQSLVFDLDRRAEAEALRRYLGSIPFGSVEIVEPSAVSDRLLALLEEFGRPIGTLLADAGLLCPRGTLLQPDGRVCASLHSGTVCEPCASACGISAPQAKSWRERRRALRDGALEFPSDEARAFAAGMLLDEKAPSPPVYVAAVDPSLSTDGLRIGLVVQGRSMDEFRLLQDLLRAAVNRYPQQAFIVVGTTADDLALMAIGNTFVSGPVETLDYPSAFRRYGIGRLVLPLRRPLFGHPAATVAKQCGLPLAYFDWSFGKAKPRRGDLALDPRRDRAEILSALAGWAGF